jgi:hypothetical protein
MKKLIEILNYYYVIDTDAEIKNWDYCINNNTLYIVHNIYPKQHKIEIFNPDTNESINTLILKINKVIATNNTWLKELPQITNVSNDMVDKEVEIELDTKCFGNNCRFNTTCNTCKEYKQVTILKPISKETSNDIIIIEEFSSMTNETKTAINILLENRKTNETLEYEPELFNDNSNVTFTVKEVREISTNLLKEYDAKLTQNPYNKGNFVGFWNYMKRNFRNRFTNTSKTNETLEEVADNYYWKLEDELNKSKGINEDNIKHRILEAVKFGYKHCEKTMYSKEEVKELLSKFQDNVEEHGLETACCDVWIKYPDIDEFINNNKK